MKHYYEDPKRAVQSLPVKPGAPADEKLPPWTNETRLVGKPLPRVDAYERVSGTAQFTHDIVLPDMLYAAILRCPHAHAMVKSIDTSAAEKMPGVLSVMTGRTPGADIPWYGMGTRQSTLFDPHCRYEGDEVAAVAAQTPYQASDALKAIKVEYEVLPFVLDEASALKTDAPKLHGSANSMGEPEIAKRGDVEKGFAEADVVLEQTFTTSVQIHATMETHGSVVRWEGDKLVVWDSTQGVYDGVLFELAGILKMPRANIRVICKYVGGGFGSKAEVSKHTVIAALLSRRTAKPVKLMISREESFLAVGNRPEAKMTMKAGVKKDGTLTALQMTNVTTVGAYAFYESFGFQAAELYKCPNVLISERTFYSNAGRARWFRAPGFPAGNWALEQMMDMLAEKLKIDPVEFRVKNFTDFSQTRNMPYTSTGFKECLIEGARAFGWAQARAAGQNSGPIKRGVGVAGGMWQMGDGGPPCTAEIRLFADGGVTITTGAMDIGTGTKTVACMVAAEELELPLETIRIENADTAITPYAPVSGGSMTLPSLIPAVRRGAWLVKRQVLPWAAEALGVPEQDVTIAGDSFVSRISPGNKKTIQEVFRAHGVMDVIGIGNREPNPSNKATMPFGAHFAEVEVDTRTGEVRVLRLLGANESGRVINRKTFDNQVIGGMNQALGYALTEKRVMDRQTGKMCNANFHDYKIPTALDVAADHQVVAIDPKDTECNNAGCKGLGEPAHVPTAAAIANAIYNAIGVRPVNGPVDPRTILNLLGVRTFSAGSPARDV
jgi:CO/xanthine dehydrogenase Mo-binding subunit